MNKVTSTALAITVVAATATTIASAASQAGQPAAGRSMRLVEVQRGDRQLDLGAKGFSAGDRQTIHSALFTPGGRPAGRLDDDCAITQAGSRPEAICTFVLTLSGGQLTGTFAQSLSKAAAKQQAITGGTGRFAGARGELRAGAEGKRTPFTIVLR
jgi:hypothetical protein